MSKSTVLLASAAFFAGVAVGFLMSPVKGGVEFHNCTMGSYNSTSGRWFSPKIAGIDNARKNKGKSKETVIPARAETNKAPAAEKEDSPVSSENKGGVRFRSCTLGSYNITSGRWFSPEIAGIDNARNGKKNKKKKKDVITAEAEPIDVSAAEITGEE